MTLYKNIRIASVIGAALLLSTGAALADGKIAAIRSADVVKNAPQYKAAETKMKSEFDKRKADLEAKGKQFADDVKAYQRDADTMAPDARAKVEKDLNTRQVDLNYAQKKFQEDLGNRDRELTGDLMGKIKTVIEAISKEKGYDMVMQDPVYVNPANDITDEVLKRLASVPATPGK
jgi:outer membrane protein